MQSSFNVIKNNSINNNGGRAIETHYEDGKYILRGSSDGVESSSNMLSYENLAASILENAKRQSEDILSNTYIRAEQIEKEAYKSAYEAGEKQGFSDSYSRAYEENVIKAQGEAEIIINNAEDIAKSADNILMSARGEYENYLLSKKSEIKNLVFDIVNNIFHREVEAEDAINAMILNALDQVKTVKTYVIKCNKFHVKAIRAAVEVWKMQLTYKCEIFIVADETVTPGNAVIDKDNGRMEVGIDIGFAKLKEILEENDI